MFRGEFIDLQSALPHFLEQNILLNANFKSKVFKIHLQKLHLQEKEF
jgi:hypothetical protein